MMEIKNEVFARAKKMGREENIQNGYAKWGEYDDLPSKLIAVAQDDIDQNGLSQGSTWHTSAIEGVVKNIIADGLDLKSNADLEEEQRTDLKDFINEFNESPNDLLSKIAYDWKVLGGFAIEVLWTAGSVTGLSSPEIGQLYHIPFAHVRAQEKNYRGFVSGYYVSKYFGARRNAVKNPIDDERAEFIPVFNADAITETDERAAQGKQLLVFQRPSRTGDYYPEPDYKGGMIDVFTDSVLRKARVTVMNNSIINSSIIQLAGIQGETVEGAVMRDFDDQVISLMSKGSPIILKKPENGQHVIGQSPGLAETADTSKDFDVDIRNRILSSHQIVSSRVLGIKEDNAGFEQQQIEQEFNVFLAFTIRPNQAKILSGLNKLSPYFFGGDLVITPIAFDLETTNQDDVTDQETDDELTPQIDA